ncbi:eukaryotic translation initiation factor 4E binding protein 1 [Columba livia]|uniref:Eukaryotic translation initiation factor 4E binding protein 1 n=1 Tax=Columba livia TaxID=8932 RepID=A0A2I0LJE5_COLLI|nr:eukaryotic translation initiation factor 4E binding protein 1 [Columba livia]
MVQGTSKMCAGKPSSFLCHCTCNASVHRHTRLQAGLLGSFPGSDWPGEEGRVPGIRSSKQGSTRIIYDRKFLMECRNSPVAKTPPSHLPDIPGVTSPSVEELKMENNHVQNCEEKVSAGEEEQFDMDI